MPANQLEAAIISGAKKAAETHLKMTGGLWLSRGPEHFLQNEVARAIWKEGFYVYIDVSEKDIRAELRDVIGPSKSLKRFDISVWYKSGGRMRAVVELKTKSTYSSTTIMADAKKIERHFEMDSPHAATGYILAYGEAYGPNRRYLLEKRFEETFPNKLGQHWRSVTSFIGADDGRWEAKDKDAAWGCGLYRFSGLI